MKRIYLTIFLVSCAVLILEISLTRLFSIYLSYHFAFLVISIAMLGTGFAGALLSIYPPLKNISNIGIYSILAGISIILGYIVLNHIAFDPVKLLWDRRQIFYVALYCLVLSIPFFFSGILIATAFSICSKRSQFIYGSDLIGAGTGSLAVLGLLNITAPEYAVLTASTLCFIASFIAGGKKIRFSISLFIAINILFFITHPDFVNVRLSPYKNLSLALKYPEAEHLKTYYNSSSRIDTLKSPAVRFAPGLSLTYLDLLPEQIGVSIDGSEMNAVTKADNKSALKFLKFLPSSLVYEIVMLRKNIRNDENNLFDNPPESPQPPFPKRGAGGDLKGRTEEFDVLILEPKGGLQVLMAKYYGFEKIHKIESNPLMVKIIRDEFGEFSGGIYEHNTWVGLGRSYLRGSQFTVHGSRHYDIIDLPMTGTSVRGVFGISEDYRFTVEAFEEYLSALKKDGLMSISLYLISPPRTELRILGILITALEQNGIKEASRHIVAIRSWDSMTILVKNTPFGEREIEQIKEFSRDRRFDLVHYPGIKQEETNLYVRMPSDEYYKAFKSLLNPETRTLFINNYLFDIEPVYDENPFFHYYLKLKNIKVIYEVMGQKWQYFIEEGYLLPLIFLQVFILSFILILLPILVKKGFKTPMETYTEVRFKQFKRLELFKQSLMLPTLLYFAMLGLGFMFVEVTLIQKGILSLENPAYTVATVLTAILISSGIGSLTSSKLPELKITYPLLILSGLILICSLTFPLLLNFISPYSIKLRIPAIFISLMPVGFFMGMPFPAGIKLLGQRNEALIPWAWAINGCLSVLAPILTIMLAVVLGFKTVLWFGAMVYLVAFVSLKKLMKY